MSKPKKKLYQVVEPYLFLLPALILFIVILIAPIAMSAYYSFFDFNSIAAKKMDFIGFDNYKTLFFRYLINPENAELCPYAYDSRKACRS